MPGKARIHTAQSPNNIELECQLLLASIPTPHPSLAELYPGLPLWVENVAEFVEALGGGVVTVEDLHRCAHMSCTPSFPLASYTHS
jgi:hypothetical protein